jgi:hypothetical protein
MPEKKPDQTSQDGAQQKDQAQTPTPVEATSQEPEKKLDETIPGGKYKTPDGRLVNANGEVIDESGKVIKE